MIRKKKTGYCDNCGFYLGNNICGAGLGRSPIPEDRWCMFIFPIRAERCGTCVHFRLFEDRTKSEDSMDLSYQGGGICSYHDDFRNFFSSCQTPGAYEMEIGKDLR